MRTRIGILLLLLFNPLYAQVESQCYEFATGKTVLTSSNIGLFKSYEDFIAGKEEIIEKITLHDNGIIIRVNKKNEKKSFEEIASSYWGYHHKGDIYRFDKKYVGSGFATKLVSIGILCLYANYNTLTITSPQKDKNDFFHYIYNCVEGGGVIRISTGLQGEIIQLNNHNFANILGQFSEGLKESYLAELEKLGRKKDDHVTSPANMDLFITYYEKINNGDYQK